MKKFFLTALLLTTSLAFAKAEVIPESLKSGLDRVFPGVEASVSKSPLPGIYEVLIDNQIFYLTEDGNHLLAGNLIETKTGRNLTKETRSRVNHNILADANMKQVISFSKPGYKHTVNVFTDVDCTYCRRFHRNMSTMNDAGIKVNYFFMPRSQGSRVKAVNVWCAKDRRTAMNKAKSGMNLASKTCSNPVETHLDLARRLGVTGTPAIFLESGSSPGGYLDPAALLKKIRQDEAGRAT